MKIIEFKIYQFSEFTISSKISKIFINKNYIGFKCYYSYCNSFIYYYILSL